MVDPEENITHIDAHTYVDAHTHTHTHTLILIKIAN